MQQFFFLFCQICKFVSETQFCKRASFRGWNIWDFKLNPYPKPGIYWYMYRNFIDISQYVCVFSVSLPGKFSSQSKRDWMKEDDPTEGEAFLFHSHWLFPSLSLFTSLFFRVQSVLPSTDSSSSTSLVPQRRSSAVRLHTGRTKCECLPLSWSLFLSLSLSLPIAHMVH